LVFGDFTGRIGDPSGRDIQRKPLTKKQLLENASTYQEQVAKILDFKKNPPEIVYNSTWWNKIDSVKFLEILTHFTFAQLSERDLFQERIKKEQPLALSEFLYPILQGYDSVTLDVDAEIGATDQTFNMLMGRAMLKIFKNKEKFVLTTPLLEGTDGRKMSKSFGNTINISSEPNQMFGNLMSIQDDLIIKYLKLTTELDQRELEEMIAELKNGQRHPMEAKKRLALEVVTLYHGAEAAYQSQLEFERVFQKGGVPIPRKFVTKNLKLKPVDFLVKSGLATSRSSARRLVEQGGVEIDGRRITNLNAKISLQDGSIARVGKLKSVVVKEK